GPARGAAGPAREQRIRANAPARFRRQRHPEGRLWPPKPASVENEFPARGAANGSSSGPSRSLGGISRLMLGRGGLCPRAGAHQVHGLGFGLRGDVLLGPLAHLIALLEQLGLLHLLEGLAESRFGVVQLRFQVVRRALEVVAPLDRRLGIGRVGEMSRIMNAGAILLDLDVALEIAADALELADHALDLGDPATPLVDLKSL